MERSARGSEGFYPSGYRWILFKWWRVMWLATRVDHNATEAAPVLVANTSANAVDVALGVAAREGDPQKVV